MKQLLKIHINNRQLFHNKLYKYDLHNFVSDKAVMYLY